MRFSTLPWPARLAAAVAALGAGLALALALTYPAIAAALCPRCYGMERAGASVIVEAAMPAPVRQRLAADAERGARQVRAFYGRLDVQPILVACASAACDRRLGGRGARAVTYSTPVAAVIRVAPRGISATILAHEIAHAQLHRQIGVLALLAGAPPAWVDEGVAVIVSNDARYLKPGPDGPARCLRRSDRPLPTRASAWRASAGTDKLLYADAACRVLRWMAGHGGRAGLRRALATPGRARAAFD